MLGLDHPDTATTVNDLANLLRALGGPSDGPVARRTGSDDIGAGFRPSDWRESCVEPEPDSRTYSG
jgi:hypothetical protein